MFSHEDFGGQLLWALERGVIVNTEGPEETFFNQPPPAAAAAPPAAAAAATDQVPQQQGGCGNDEVQDGAEELPHWSSKTSWLMVGTILMLMITWLQQEQLPWLMTAMNQLQRMCQLLLRQ